MAYKVDFISLFDEAFRTRERKCSKSIW